MALLRREGVRVPHAADRPLQPRGHQIAAADGEPSWITGRLGRRAGGAAGAFVAIASVLGAAVVTDSTGGPPEPGLISPAPEAGAVDGGASTLPGLAPLPQDAVSLAGFEAAAQAARGGDPGSILLPGAVARTPGDTGVPGVSAATTPGVLGGVVTGAGDYVGQTVSGTTKTLGDTVSGATKGLGATASGATDAVGDLVGGPAGGVVSDAGEAVGGLVEGTGKTLGDTVAGTGKTLGDTTEKLTDPVGGLLGGGNGSSSRSGEGEGRDSAVGSLDTGTAGGGGGLLGSVGKVASGLLGG
ncbi:hypothetical protein [Pseudonocardia sp.]|uniref:hypothetical protein n=1 Tax=Pseudonocardia sp. TaxID=60912 RepID=UPI003D0DE125